MSATAKLLDDDRDLRAEIFDKLCDLLMPYEWAHLREVAETADVSAVTLYNWVSGKTMNPHINTLISVAMALGYEIRLVRRSAKLRLVK